MSARCRAALWNKWAFWKWADRRTTLRLLSAVITGNHIYRRCLSGTIRPDQRMDSSLLDLEI